MLVLEEEDEEVERKVDEDFFSPFPFLSSVAELLTDFDDGAALLALLAALFRLAPGLEGG